MSPVRLAVAGAAGRVGQALLRLAAADPELRIVAALERPDSAHLGVDAGTLVGGAPLGVKVGAACETPPDVLVEFSRPDAAVAWAEWCAARGVAFVSGTTGLEERHTAALRRAAERCAVLWSPNMSIGANLVMRLVREVAARLGNDWDIEITEAHHRHKVDAPSGTAKALLAAACAGRGVRAADVAVYGREGQTGTRPAGQIGVHALRMGDVIGDHEIIFHSPMESVSLRHRVSNRDTFAAGALRAACWLAGKAPRWYTMADILDGGADALTP
ncbi:MAG: 4-hydroxy-tetrahydrodipicolinate reductase [Phycisphaerae bacterium]